MIGNGVPDPVVGSVGISPDGGSEPEPGRGIGSGPDPIGIGTSPDGSSDPDPGRVIGAGPDPIGSGTGPDPEPPSSAHLHFPILTFPLEALRSITPQPSISTFLAAPEHFRSQLILLLEQEPLAHLQSTMHLHSVSPNGMTTFDGVLVALPAAIVPGGGIPGTIDKIKSGMHWQSSGITAMLILSSAFLVNGSIMSSGQTGTIMSGHLISCSIGQTLVNPVLHMVGIGGGGGQEHEQSQTSAVAIGQAQLHVHPMGVPGPVGRIGPEPEPLGRIGRGPDPVGGNGFGPEPVGGRGIGPEPVVGKGSGPDPDPVSIGCGTGPIVGPFHIHLPIEHLPLEHFISTVIESSNSATPFPEHLLSHFTLPAHDADSSSTLILKSQVQLLLPSFNSTPSNLIASEV